MFHRPTSRDGSILIWLCQTSPCLRSGTMRKAAPRFEGSSVPVCNHQLTCTSHWLPVSHTHGSP